MGSMMTSYSLIVAWVICAFHCCCSSCAIGDGSVQLTVTRIGTLDTVDVQWSVGPLVGGAVTPPTGSVTLPPSQVSADFSLTVRGLQYLIDHLFATLTGQQYVTLSRVSIAVDKILSPMVNTCSPTINNSSRSFQRSSTSQPLL